MLSPRYLDGLADEITEIYSQLESEILQDMARRIARLGKVTDATKWQAQMLIESGGLKKNIARILAKYDKTIAQQVKDTVTAALEASTKNDNKIFKEATGRTVSTPNAQQMLSTIQKCHSDLSRLTLTTAATTQTEFVQQANRVYMNVQSGAFDYDTAMKSAADELAKRGITAVQYENGRPVTRTIESAVRMNILTSVNQTAANQTLNNCEELDCDLVETSAHIGARPEHEDWQGEVFSRSGTNPKYRPFSVCELGSVTGICGINCKHSFYPYFEGMAEHYTEKELDEMASEKVTYTDKDGRDHVMTRYEGEQKLRYIEKNIRHYKREALTQEAAGVDNTRARRKIGEWQAAARDFTTQTGIARDGAREYVGTSGKQPLALKPVVKESLTTQTATAKSGFSAMTDGEYNAAIAKCAKSITPQEAAQIDQHELGGRMRGYVRTSNSRIINRVIKNNGIGALDADDKKTVEALQKAISKNTLEKDTVLIRNIKPQWLESRFGIKGKYGLDDFATDIKDDTTVIKQIESTLPGKTVVENKFLSCSVDATRNYFNKYGVTIEIHAPKGTHCYFPNNKPESEAILDIGQKLKIISAKVNADRVNVVCELITEVEK